MSSSAASRPVRKILIRRGKLRQKIGATDKWDAYVDAVNEMLYRTDTPYAPWTVVEGNNKYYARLKVMSTMIDRMEKALAAVDDKAGSKAKKG